jgi:hypothetical protein
VELFEETRSYSHDWVPRSTGTSCPRPNVSGSSHFSSNPPRYIVERHLRLSPPRSWRRLYGQTIHARRVSNDLRTDIDLPRCARITLKLRPCRAYVGPIHIFATIIHVYGRKAFLRYKFLRPPQLVGDTIDQGSSPQQLEQPM